MAIRHCHENSVIHADIKLLNFLIHESHGSMSLLLCDFGLSQKIDSDLGGFHMKELTGTGGYFAPECGKDTVVTSAIDLWSFGICLYEMAVGYKP